MPAEAVRLRVHDVRYYMRNVRLRMPFRYGVAQLVGYPILHVRVDIETSDGVRSEGVAADCLPPKWFDKDPAKDYEDNIDDMLAAVSDARDAYVVPRGAGCGYGLRRQSGLQPPDRWVRLELLRASRG